MMRRAVTVLIVSSLAILVASGLETHLVAQPHQPAVKKLPTGSVLREPQIVEGEVLVKYKEAALGTREPSERARKLLELRERLPKEFRGTIITSYPTLGIQHLKLPPGVSVPNGRRRLKSVSVVEFVEPNYKLFPLYSSPPNDAKWAEGELWGMNNIGMKQAWSDSTANIAGNVIIAVIDSGINVGHQDLHPHMWNNKQEFEGSVNNDEDGNGIYDDIYGASFCTDSTGTHWQSGNVNDNPSNPHGTMVAGVIGAVVDNSTVGGGQKGYVAGVHREAKLMALKVICGPDGNVADAISAIKYAWEHGATILNASWFVASGTEIISAETGHSSGNNALKLAIQEAGSHNALLVAASGNSSAQRDNDLFNIYPANYGAEGLDNVIAVAATMDKCPKSESRPPKDGKCFDDSTLAYSGPTFSEEFWDQVRSDGSHYGSHFGRNKVHIAAPGHNIYSTALTTPPDEVLMLDGTSMAVPHVAGCAALLQAKRLATNPLSPFLPKDLKKLIMDTGDPLPSLAQTSLTPTASGRRLNCSKALHPGDTISPATPTNLGVR